MRTAALALSILLVTVPTAAHETTSKPAWFYCYRHCISALEKESSPPPEQPPSEHDALDRLLGYETPNEGDGGVAFERFKICNALCREGAD